MMIENVGTSQIVVLAVVLFILFAGRRLPALGKSLGNAVKETKKALKSN